MYLHPNEGELHVPTLSRERKSSSNPPHPLQLTPQLGMPPVHKRSNPLPLARLLVPDQNAPPPQQRRRHVQRDALPPALVGIERLVHHADVRIPQLLDEVGVVPLPRLAMHPVVRELVQPRDVAEVVDCQEAVGCGQGVASPGGVAQAAEVLGFLVFVFAGSRGRRRGDGLEDALVARHEMRRYLPAAGGEVPQGVGEADAEVEDYDAAGWRGGEGGLGLGGVVAREGQAGGCAAWDRRVVVCGWGEDGRDGAGLSEGDDGVDGGGDGVDEQGESREEGVVDGEDDGEEALEGGADEEEGSEGEGVLDQLFGHGSG